MDLNITPEQEQLWRTQGFAVVDGFDVSAARAEANFTAKSSGDDFGSASGSFEFPTGYRNLDLLPIRLFETAKRLLKTDKVILSQADTWIKKAKKIDSELCNSDQRMHCDFGNNTLVLEPFDQPHLMAAIIYLDSSTESKDTDPDNITCSGGATAAVPRLGINDTSYDLENLTIMPGYNGIPFKNDRKSAEKWFQENRPEQYEFRKKLYEREIKVYPKVGRILLYRVDLWHRGTVLQQGTRRVMNLTYHIRDHPSHASSRWNQGFLRKSYDYKNGIYGVPEKLFSQILTPNQRCALGFPAVGDSFWTPQRLLLIKLRFPEFDVTPYLAAIPDWVKKNAQQGKYLYKL